MTSLNHSIPKLISGLRLLTYARSCFTISGNIERIGDHAVNLSEWVEFSVTGVHKGESEI